MRVAPQHATQMAARVGQDVAVIFGVVGLFVRPLLMVIAVLAWPGAQAEYSVSAMKVALSGLSVRHGMITDFKAVSPIDPLSRAVELTLAGFQPWQPLDRAPTRIHQGEWRLSMVLENERVVGLLTVGNVGELLALEAAGLVTGPLTVEAGQGTVR
jgi:hypothetical protein